MREELGSENLNGKRKDGLKRGREGGNSGKGGGGLRGKEEERKGKRNEIRES